ncbi:hypothetical protein [Paenibacillus silviterrae]|uniref:hypothetical protein n=1 Tax=Paenibacillus silviterrae TaxID=3242194 RepID=UPI002542BF8F|nr:hypothetical protein [Paenibacillus chinjuensis]
MAENQQNTVQHGLNAAQANAESEQDQQQVQALASQLQQGANQTNEAQEENNTLS